MKKAFQITLLLGIIIFFCVSLGRNLDHPLMSYDEAWYGAIAKDILVNGHVFFQRFNGDLYFDHPPFGFWSMALSMKLFGINEIALRLPSLISGLFSLIFIYLLARRRSNSWYGLAAVIMLASSLWFTYRIRSGNLDGLLIGFFLASYYFSERFFSNKHSRLGAYGLIISLAGLFLTKTLVGFSIIPVMIGQYLFADKKIRPSISMLFLQFIGVLILCLPWYWFNYVQHTNFVEYHFFRIGTREGAQNATWIDYQRTLLFLRSGIGRWYYPTLVSLLFGAIFSFYRKFRNPLIVSDLVFLLAIGIPFFKSPETEVWHLIPLYVPLFLSLISVSWIISTSFKKITHLAFIPYIVWIGFMIIGIQQYSSVMKLLEQNAGSSEADISIKAQHAPSPVLLNGPFLPAFLYYSDQEFVASHWLRPNAYEVMTEMLLFPAFPTTFVTSNATLVSLDKDKIPYVVYDKNQDYSIITTQSIKESP